MPEPGSPGAGERIGSILLPGVQQGAPGGGPLVMPFGDGTAILQAGAGAAAGHYRIDPERAPEVIAAFQKAAEDLRLLLGRAEALGSIPPPGLDGVSLNAVQEMGDWAMGEHGSLRMALEQGADSLDAAAVSLQAQLDAFLQAEETNAMRSGGSAL